ncbi:L-serine ammonia-lyase, iron-sulfur-dependent subunit beta [Lacrimispora saccharolytica]|jgi:L-serine dehydratase|uniref:L-serine deaminase n=1 Tax=Lacrimispora saccharolytica (strain ATCC 35040 / DSM 2544 / NRCC 2533 / WM1) TaxID=610130 RepID=D9R2X0_LACSW|nr:L-serine ammonia-lyase, iron-sulfur-dependent subunit beta [Lacrimispora saccharolytica]ADL02960.1 L-serine dehydratase, iron-sulfur-dependent, beta subunit [[Clostridium] saccharolyticum WM1]QRV18847.1 L-serine ammonia-lyase, iron-sulfur-dependent subunit beta [Lacrimispora saccharolytica]
MPSISIFDVIGPNMVGPSSSHTAGAVAIALLVKKMFNGPIKKVEFVLYGSFAKTYKGHGTDRALLGGILGFETYDLRIKNSFQLADECGLMYSFCVDEKETEVHPNTVEIHVTGENAGTMSVRGVSLGGGKVKIIRINGIDVDFTGEYSTLVIRHLDYPGMVAYIATSLSERNVNIAFMRLFRERKGATAYSVVESDEEIPQELLEKLREHPKVEDVMLIQV